MLANPIISTPLTHMHTHTHTCIYVCTRTLTHKYVHMHTHNTHHLIRLLDQHSRGSSLAIANILSEIL